MFTIQYMSLYLCILKLYHARPCAHARLCMLFLNPGQDEKNQFFISLIHVDLTGLKHAACR
jgi:hypothetical protein